jgi:hypothetical protein
MLINPMDVQYQRERLEDMRREAERADLLRQVREDQVIENGNPLSLKNSSHWLTDRVVQDCQPQPKQWGVSDAS